MGENKNTPIIAAGLVVVALIAGGISYQFMPKSAASGVKPTKADEERKVWLHQKAMECQGDASKLSAEDQQQAAKYLGNSNYVGMVMATEYKTAKK